RRKSSASAPASIVAGLLEMRHGCAARRAPWDWSIPSARRDARPSEKGPIQSVMSPFQGPTIISDVPIVLCAYVPIDAYRLVFLRVSSAERLRRREDLRVPACRRAGQGGA